MRKRKKDFLLEKGNDIVFLFQAVSVEPTTSFLQSGVLGTMLRLMT